MDLEFAENLFLKAKTCGRPSTMPGTKQVHICQLSTHILKESKGEGEGLYGKWFLRGDVEHLCED